VTIPLTREPMEKDVDQRRLAIFDQTMECSEGTEKPALDGFR
jgi:hypothetical protein